MRESMKHDTWEEQLKELIDGSSWYVILVKLGKKDVIFCGRYLEDLTGQVLLSEIIMI